MQLDTPDNRSSGAIARQKTGVLADALWRHLLPQGEKDSGAIPEPSPACPRNLLDLYWPLAEDGAILDAEKKSPARFIVEKRAGAVTHHNPELWRRIQEQKP